MVGAFGNLFVCRLGLDVDFVKVLDFGLVKVQGPQAQGAEALTMEGAFAGTPSFMPPEVALGAAPIDERADIYALGCVAYWLLTGRLVFERANVMQMVIDHVRTPPARRPIARSSRFRKAWSGSSCGASPRTPGTGRPAFPISPRSSVSWTSSGCGPRSARGNGGAPHSGGYARAEARLSR